MGAKFYVFIFVMFIGGLSLFRWVSVDSMRRPVPLSAVEDSEELYQGMKQIVERKERPQESVSPPVTPMNTGDSHEARPVEDSLGDSFEQDQRHKRLEEIAFLKREIAQDKNQIENLEYAGDLEAARYVRKLQYQKIDKLRVLLDQR